MPDIFRLPLRMDCSGVDYTHAVDRMPPGSFPYLQNARVIVEGALDGRPGYTSLLTLNDQPNSIRRLNDPDESHADLGYIYVGGAGNRVYTGQGVGYVSRDTGYSGNPLSLIPFRPDQSPESWMYIYDALKQSKTNGSGVVYPMGIAPPTSAPAIEYGIPASVEIADGQTTTGWTASGGASTPATATRVTDTIGQILYNSGSTGWCCIVPSSGDQQYGDRMQLTINSGGGTAEAAVIREYHPSAGANTTVAAIAYDSGSSGVCTLTLTANPIGVVERNSVVALGSGPTYCRVLEAILTPDGTNYCLRLSTGGATISAGNTVVFSTSLYLYTVNSHAASEPIIRKILSCTGSTATGELQYLSGSAINASVAGGRPIDPANDYLHLTLYFPAGATASTVQVALNFTNGSFSFSSLESCYLWNVPFNVGSGFGPGYYEILLPLSAATVYGPVSTLNAVWGIAVQYNGSCIAMAVADCYLFGTYGPVIQPNAPLGYAFQYRYRDSTTGAHSVPSPQNRYNLNPLREEVLVTTVAAGGIQTFVDTADVYVVGGNVPSPLYAGSVAPGAVLGYTLPDDSVLATNQPPDLGAFQPWPTLQLPINGTCNVVGTHISITGGSAAFNLNMISNTILTVGGVAYLTYGQPTDTNNIQLTQSGGVQNNVPFTIASPTIAAVPLPFAFGALEGPFAPVIFALGDPVNGGLLYFSNFNDADSASDANTLELAGPGNDLVSGDVWHGMVFAGNQDEIFVVRYSYLTTIGASTNTSFQWNKINASSGMWSRWACCATPIGVAYLGRDGLYMATDGGSVNISDDKLYPLFPHEGQPARAVVLGNITIPPVDMTQVKYLRLSYCDQELRFCYIDTQGNFNTLIYEIYKKRWLPYSFASQIGYQYLEELPAVAAIGSQQQSILGLDLQRSKIVQMGGNDDDGTDIHTVIITPSQDGGDERSQKLYVDAMIQADGTGVISVQAVFDNAQTYTPVGAINITTTGIIQQFQENLASLSQLSLYRNVGAKFSWSGGPAGPRLYAYEISGYLQPYLSKFLVTQFITLSFPGWKHHRRSYPALISNNPVLFTIKTQDGRTYGPYTIPSTAGQFRVLPFMLDQTIKDLAFAYQLDGQGNTFALFPSDFVIETKQWQEDSFISLAVFKS